MSTVAVRPARVSDADDIGMVHVASWHQRLAGVLPDEVLSSLSADDLAMTWARSILNPPLAGQAVVVATQVQPDATEAIVGFAAFGPSQEPDALPGEYELVALEVAPGHQRAGHGSRLMAAAIDLAREAGATSACAWCPLEDSIRRGFLQSAGWEPDSARRDLATGPDTTVREVRLVVSLAA